MLWSIAADERAALQFDDVASALDAGLPIASIGGEASDGDRAVHGALARRGVVLTPTEDAVLLAAWRSGRVGAALRGRGRERRERAELARRMWASIRYPAFVFLLVIVASFATAQVIGHYWFAVGVIVLGAVIVGGLVLARRGLRSGGEAWMRVPILGRIAVAFGELPYLETLASLYGAGVPLPQAHTAAVATVPVSSVQARLRVADRGLQEGRSLAESLAQAVALHPETRSLLSTGEHAGQLEDALHRALARRRDVAVRDVADTARRAAAIVYGLAVVAAAALVMTFWLRLYGTLGRR